MRYAPYEDRTDAGRALAAELKQESNIADALVLGLPRGGVPVAAEVAQVLDAPLDIVVVRKLGFPGHPETAMGAIASVGGTMELVQNMDVMAHLDRVEDGQTRYKETLAREKDELRRRDREYRAGRTPSEVRNRHVIVIDDGLATGASMRAAVAALSPLGPRRVTVAVPIASPRAVSQLLSLVDDVVCPWQPEDFRAVGEGYVSFDQTQDDEVRAHLTWANDPDAAGD
ncbi:Predicted phosphoribosyltransferase [Arthrobacter subterraneus]|uniref:Predicted phosphoribosyltransferase n=1 Tax=Arthrobacter subterraneus TaxID=335973 RepID=A0A1G8Q834_9MICC|nr:phosphoribosyltransferase family protein [Arthrobacter subterraneus]SDJ00635.1 Predicted phosphoribosyltransferase [Arthrobacter subterraneus]